MVNARHHNAHILGWLHILHIHKEKWEVLEVVREIAVSFVPPKITKDSLNREIRGPLGLSDVGAYGHWKSDLSTCAYRNPHFCLFFCEIAAYFFRWRVFSLWSIV